MLQFVDIRNHRYIVVDEDVLYVWETTQPYPYIEWMKIRDKYTFRLSFKDGDTYINVYNDGVPLVHDKIVEVEYL